jgi:hypothetical protein
MLSPRRLLLCAAWFAAASACARHDSGAPGAGPLGIPLFETRIEIPTGTGVHADFHVADFDGNGSPDLAVISLSGEMHVLHGNGTGFVAGQSLTLGGGPIWLSGGDFDGDGDRDLVVVRSLANTTDVYLNDGSGTFSPGVSLPVGQDALAVVVGDVDFDGALDILVARPEAPEIVVYLGDGNGGFTATAPIALPGGGVAFTLTLGDVTGDGWLDVLVADPARSRVLVYPGSGPNQTFGGGVVPLEFLIPGAPRAVSVGDLNGDGRNDMVVSAFESNRFVVVTDYSLGVPAGGSGTTPVTYQSFDVVVSSAPSLSTIGDVTGDGRPDLVACLGSHASMVVVPQLANGTLGEQLQFDATGLPLRPFIGDLDGNGKNDLLVLSGLGDRINLWLARGTGDLIGARNYDTGLPSAPWLAGADFDRDGQPEVALASIDSSLLKIMRRRSDGALEVVQAIDVGTPLFQVRTADLDRDGRIDIVASAVGGMKLLRNRSTRGNLQFELVPGLVGTIGTLTGPFGFAVADLDRDGDFDLAIADFLGGAVHVIPGTKTPFVFGAQRTIPVPGGPVDVVAADFTGDGRLDLAVSRLQFSDVGVLQNRGNLQFDSLASIPVGQAPNFLITADFDGNGRADLVISNGNAGTLTVLFGSADGFTAQTFPAGATPTALLAQDLTGDGRLDILVTSLVSGDFRVLVGDGAGGFPSLVRFPGTRGATNAVLLDMDLDGKRDLLIASLLTSRVSLVRNIRPGR